MRSISARAPLALLLALPLLAGCLAEGMAVLIVTHAAEQARRLAHRIFHLERGRLTTP